MKQFFGYLTFKEPHSKCLSDTFDLWPATGNRNLAAGCHYHCDEWFNAQLVLTQCSVSSTRLLSVEHTSERLCVHEDSGCQLLGQVRIDNLDEIRRQLPADMQACVFDSETAILFAYLHWGEACCDYLVGDFAFAIYDPRQRRLFLARDQLGVKPLYYYWHNGDFAFANDLAELVAMPGIMTELNNPWLAGYTLGVSADWQQTPYRYIHKVPPAHYLIIDDAQQLIMHRYFEFSSDADWILSSDEEYVEAYQEVLKSAVECRVSDVQTVAAELSGGLDSSSVAALAARSMQCPAKELHLMGFARNQWVAEAMAAVAQTSPVAMTHFLTQTHNHVMSVDQFNTINGAPCEHQGASGHYPFYRLCNQLGAGVLLSGVGGDEFVTSAAPTAMVEFWRHQQPGLFYSRQRGNIVSKPLHTLRWLYHYYRYANHSISARRLAEAGAQTWRMHLLKDEFAEKHGLQKRLFDTLKYDGGKTTQNKFALSDRLSPALTARLENSAAVAGHFGIDYRFPLLDVRLLTLFFSIPASQKLGPGMVGRYLHRRAVTGIVPNYIAWGPKDLIKHHWFRRAVQGQCYQAEVSKPNYLFTAKAMQGIDVPKQVHKPQSNSPKATVLSATTINSKINSNIKQALSSLDPALESVLDSNKIATLADQLENNRKLEPGQLTALNNVLNLNCWLKQKSTNDK